MKIRVKDTKGITLIALVITIVVILILASVVTYSGIDAINTAKLNRFMAEMEIMQTHVNDMYDKCKNGGAIGNYEGNNILNIGKDISQAQDKANIVFQTDTSGITNTEGYKYFDSETIKALGIENIQEEFFINILKRSVISVTGLECNDKICYTLEQLDRLYNVEYKENTLTPTFNVKSDVIGENKYKITIEPIYSGNIQKWEVKYQLDGDSYWNTSKELTFNIEKAGKYNIKIQNGDVQSEQKTQYLGYVTDGMLLHYDGITNTRNGSNKSAETNTWEDLSGNRNDGILKNFNSSWSEDSLTFDGIDDYVAIKQLNYKNITMEAVVEFTEHSSTDERSVVSNFESGGYGISTFGDYSITDRSRNAFTVYIDDTYYCATATSSIVDGQKYILTGNYNGEVINFWQNGAKTQTTKSGNIRYPYNNTIMILGANPGGNEGRASWLKGKIYSVRFYNRALTDEEVKINYEIDKTRFNIQ